MVDDIKYVCMLWRVGCTKGKVSNYLVSFGYCCRRYQAIATPALPMCKHCQHD
jgi:hypothetical protein